ncbi:MAG: 4-alpha-glucanotransferase [Deltaproteobacteria bacterium]|nr:4-alpha-glucanotransferase [Deltaproteobacteria bacterium]
MLGRRESGILLHLTSLPSPFGIGDLGPWACRFADFLAAGRQKYWQILPLNPTDPIHNDSPYSCLSAFACNPLLISPELLVQDRLLLPADLEVIPDFPAGRVDFPAVHALKAKLLEKAYERFQKEENHREFFSFCEEESFWLDDFSLFRTMRRSRRGEIWSDWPAPLRDRHPEAIQAARKEFADTIEREKFYQFLFFKQWQDLRRYAKERGIQIIGDIPIYIDYDSADVWVHPDLFKLNDRKKPEVVAGVPPDYFSKTGQRWGNPIYRWEVMKESGYAWWLERMDRNLNLLDWVRIDHFRGLVAFWEIPAEKETAVDGRWVAAPARDFLTHLVQKFPRLPVIAEDLGIITPDVHDVMKQFGFPGMKVLLFAFGQDLPANPYIPHNLPRNCIAYTGTHDNNTVRGWFQGETSPEDRKRIFRYLGREVAPEELPREFIRLLMRAAADTIILPMQDVLGLGAEARTNQPATRRGNWEWRLNPEMLTSDIFQELGDMTEIYGRTT